MRIKGKHIFRHLKYTLRYKANYWKLRGTVILVYTGGKVGSSSVYHSLKDQFPFLSVYHVHFLTEEWLKYFEETQKWTSNIRAAKDVRQAIKNKPKIKIITLVREPVSREISNVFQNWQTIFELENYDDLTDNHVKGFLEANEFNQTEHWFQTEFKVFTGYNILDKPFDKSKGYSIFNKGELDVLCIKLESLNDVFTIAMKSFLGIEVKKMEIKNVSNNKSSAVQFNRIKKGFSLPEHRLEYIYSKEFVNHFYTENEIMNFKERWSINS